MSQPDDRTVADNVLHADPTVALGAEPFPRTVQVTARLGHPPVLPLLDSGGQGDLLDYVMPFIVGESLRDQVDPPRDPLRDDPRFQELVRRVGI